MMLSYALLFGLAAASCLCLTPLVARLAVRLGAIDLPGERRIHARATPRLGGLGIYASVAASLGVARLLDPGVAGAAAGSTMPLGAVALATTIVAVLGAVDDVRPLSPRVKLAVQCAAAGLVTAAGVAVREVLGVDVGWLGVPLTIFWMVGVTNALNLIDGLDGLAAGVGTIVAVTLFAVSVSSGAPVSGMILAALAGALLGFLRYNFHPARIFMGDSGSLFIGFLLAVTSVTASSKPEAVVAFAVPIVALGLPIADTLLAVARRLLRAVHVLRSDAAGERYEFLFLGKAALFTADRDHIHHRLLALGISQPRAVLLLYAICMLCGAGAFGLVFVRTPDQGFLVGAFAIAAFVGIRRLDYGELRMLRRGTLLPIFGLPIVNRRLLHVLADLGFVILAHFAAHWIAAEGRWTASAWARVIDTAAPVALAQIAVLAAAGLYRVSLSRAETDDLLAAGRSVLLATVAGWAVRQAALGFAAPGLGVAVLDGYVLATLVIGVRMLFPILHHLFARHRDAERRVLIYGAGRDGLAALHAIEEDPALGRKVVGFVDDAPPRDAGLLGGHPLYSTDQLYDFAFRHGFDELVVADRRLDRDVLADLARIGTRLRVRRFATRWEDVLPYAPRGAGTPSGAVVAQLDRGAA